MHSLEPKNLGAKQWVGKSKIVKAGGTGGLVGKGAGLEIDLYNGDPGLNPG